MEPAWTTLAGKDDRLGRTPKQFLVAHGNKRPKGTCRLVTGGHPVCWEWSPRMGGWTRSNMVAGNDGSWCRQPFVYWVSLTVLSGFSLSYVLPWIGLDQCLFPGLFQAWANLRNEEIWTTNAGSDTWHAGRRSMSCDPPVGDSLNFTGKLSLSWLGASDHL